MFYLKAGFHMIADDRRHYYDLRSAIRDHMETSLNQGLFYNGNRGEKCGGGGLDCAWRSLQSHDHRQPRSQGLSSSRPSERERETLVGTGHVTAYDKLLPSRGTLAQLFYSQEAIRDFQVDAI